MTRPRIYPTDRRAIFFRLAPKQHKIVSDAAKRARRSVGQEVALRLAAYEAIHQLPDDLHAEPADRPAKEPVEA
jgi:hypothetical protein